MPPAGLLTNVQDIGKNPDVTPKTVVKVLSMHFQFPMSEKTLMAVLQGDRALRNMRNENISASMGGVISILFKPASKSLRRRMRSLFKLPLR